jgi:hypothetical protein
MYTSINKKLKIISTFISVLQGKVLKEVFLFQLTPQVRDTLSRAIYCSRQSVGCTECGWFCYGRYILIYPEKVPQNIPVTPFLSRAAIAGDL